MRRALLPMRLTVTLAFFRTLSASLALSLATSGCVTSLGYYQANLKVKDVQGATNWVPAYETVKHWAYDVQDGFDSRATLNHYALQYGTLFALAAAGTMAGLGIFSPGSPALQGIPLGTAFLSGAAAYYDNHFRYDMYSRASSLVRALIDVSDERVTKLGIRVDLATEARCLKEEVGHVVDLVRRHIALSDPNNLAAELRAITSSVDQGKVAELVKAAQGDLSDLNLPGRLRETYCQATGLLAGPLEDPRPLISTTQAVLMSLAEDRAALDTAIVGGQAEHDRLATQADDLAKTKTEVTVKTARGKIEGLKGALKAASDTLTRAKAVGATTAATYIATLNDPQIDTAKKLDTASKLFEERETIRVQDQETVAATAKIKAAVGAAQDAIKAVADK